jgi:hypothetical protein
VASWSRRLAGHRSIVSSNPTGEQQRIYPCNVAWIHGLIHHKMGFLFLQNAEKNTENNAEYVIKYYTKYVKYVKYANKYVK